MRAYLVGVAVLSTAVCLAGCGDSSNIAEPLPAEPDPVRIAATIDGEVSRFLLTNEALVSVFSVARSIVTVGGAQSRASVPTEIVGGTFVWSHERNGYEIDSSLSGAPTDGIRFRLYDIDSSSSLPSLPLNDIGWLDVVETRGGNAGITLDAVASGVHLIDHQLIGASLHDHAATVFFADGEDSSEIRFEASSDASRRLTTFRAEFGLMTIRYRRSFSIETLSTSTEVTVSDAATSTVAVFLLMLDRNNNVQQGSGVTLNGTRVATITGNSFEAQIDNASGSDLSPVELEALSRAFGSVDQIFVVLSDINRIALLLLGVRLL